MDGDGITLRAIREDEREAHHPVWSWTGRACHPESDRLPLFVDKDFVGNQREAAMDRALLVRAKDGKYAPLAEGRTPGPGDRVLSARWIALGN